MRNTTRGVLSAIGAFCLWGLTPLYWTRLEAVPAFEVILHRIWWSFPFLWIIVLVRFAQSRRRTSDRNVSETTTEKTNSSWIRVIIPSGRVFLRTTVAGVLVTVNWLTYVWAVTNGRTLEASLGYYINPLVSVALGAFVLRERLDRFQTIAVILATSGVLYLTLRVGTIPWISLILAGSFGVYGLIKKQVPVGATHSLALELIPLAPPAFIIIIFQVVRGTSMLTTINIETSLLLVGAGVVTVIPLILFGYAARNIRLADVGFVQYIAPTGMLILGVFVFGETFDTMRLPGFLLVWAALLLYSVSSILRKRGNGVGAP